MGEAQQKQTILESSYGIEGFEQIFEQRSGQPQGGAVPSSSTVSGAASPAANSEASPEEQFLGRFTDLFSLSIDQRAETAKIAAQLIENQRQLIATQQILIRLMERSIELTRHISSIEERLPTILELPRIVESLRLRLAQLEGIEV